MRKKREKKELKGFVLMVFSITILYFIVNGFSLYFFDQTPSQIIANFITR